MRRGAADLNMITNVSGMSLRLVAAGAAAAAFEGGEPIGEGQHESADDGGAPAGGVVPPGLGDERPVATERHVVERRGVLRRVGANRVERRGGKPDRRLRGGNPLSPCLGARDRAKPEPDLAPPPGVHCRVKETCPFADDVAVQVP